jgi:catechol 2,3-dioxygenase-like lactoylglutathione lyase family enzyme/uncharacterized protein YndB with AHSA1/START domain
MTELRMNQIALSVSDVQHSQRWYRDIFGYQEAGGTHMFIPLLGSADVQGVPEATSICWWIMDQQDYFQLELFEFSKPTPKPLPNDWRPCDIGYTTIGIHVDDFDATLERLARRHVPLLTDPLGDPGARRVCVRDPDGILLEIMEDDPRTSNPRSRPHAALAATRFVTLSVPDLDQARRTWLEVLELPEEKDVVLHTPEHERLWGLEGASRESFVARSGDMFIEVVQYLDPAGEPWPEGYYISDLGLLNIALAVPTADEQKALVQRCTDAGITANTTKGTALSWRWYATYVNDPMGFSIELLWHDKPGQKMPVDQFNLLELGFTHKQAPVTRVEASQVCSAPPEQVWAVLTDHEHMADWSPFSTSEVVSRPGDGEVGTVRKLSGGPAALSLTETIVAAEEPYRLEYKAQGAPAQSRYHGFVTLEPTPGGGTEITWEAQFRSNLPGAGAITRRMLQQLVSGLTQTAQQQSVA